MKLLLELSEETIPKEIKELSLYSTEIELLFNSYLMTCICMTAQLLAIMSSISISKMRSSFLSWSNLESLGSVGYT